MTVRRLIISEEDLATKVLPSEAFPRSDREDSALPLRVLHSTSTGNFLRTPTMTRKLWFLWLFLPVLCLAQPHPDTLWTRLFGDIPMNWGMDVQQTTDGGFVLLNRGYQNPGSVTKYSADGDVEWTHFCDFDGHFITTYRIAPTLDNGCVYIGLDQVLGTAVVRLGADGEVVWTRWMAGTRSIYSRFILAGEWGGCTVLSDNSVPEGANSSFTITRFSDIGDEVWSHIYEYGTRGMALALEPTADGGYCILSNYVYNNTVWRLNSQGDTLWTQPLHFGSQACISTICRTAEGNFAFVGSRPVDGGVSSLCNFIGKMTAEAETLWTRNVYINYPLSINAISQDLDEGFYLTGIRNLGGSSSNIQAWVGQVNATGDTLWQWTYGDRAEDHGLMVRALTDGGAVMSGKVNMNSDIGTQSLIARFALTSPNSAIRLGVPQEPALLSSYPNPFNAVTEIQIDLPKATAAHLAVYDLLGRETAALHDGALSAGNHRFIFDAGSLPSGVYLARLDAAGVTRVQKMVLLK
jgi:hypothetical protein